MFSVKFKIVTVNIGVPATKEKNVFMLFIKVTRTFCSFVNDTRNFGLKWTIYFKSSKYLKHSCKMKVVMRVMLTMLIKKIIYI